MLDENEFLSPYGIRSMSKVHHTDPFMMEVRKELSRAIKVVKCQIQYFPNDLKVKYILSLSLPLCACLYQVGGEHHCVSYVPGESNTYLFGGNSNWRGPIWLCGE